MKNVLTKIDEALYDRARIAAIRHKMTLQEFILHLIKEATK